MENNLLNIGQNGIMADYKKTDDILKDMCRIIDSSRKAAYQAVNAALVQRNWLLGYRISEEELQPMKIKNGQENTAKKFIIMLPCVIQKD